MSERFRQGILFSSAPAAAGRVGRAPYAVPHYAAASEAFHVEVYRAGRALRKRLALMGYTREKAPGPSFYLSPELPRRDALERDLDWLRRNGVAVLEP
jgi:hypothetical protein